MKRLLVILCALMLLTGCTKAPPQQKEEASQKSVVTINAITLGIEPAGGLDNLYAQLDQLTIPELGCRLRFTYIPWGDERNQLNIAISSGEYDIIPQGNFSDYQLMASRNAFLDIKPYLSLMPDLVAHYQQDGEDALALAEIGGKLYGIPQYSKAGVAANEGFLYREDLRKAWGLPPITDLDTMEAYLYRARADEAFAGHPLITDNRIWTCLWTILTQDDYFDMTGYTDAPYAICAIDAPYTVISRIETPAFRTVLEYLTKWYRDGILDKRLLTLSGNEGTSGRAMMLSGLKPCETNSPMWSLNRDWAPALQEAHPDWELGFFAYGGEGRVMNYKTSASSGSVLAISSRTKHPEIAVKLLEKVHTDQRYYDLVLYGVEGEHYYRDENGIYMDGIAPEKRFAGWTAVSDVYLDYPTTYRDASPWTKNIWQPHVDLWTERSETAEFHPLNRFDFNVTSVSSETLALAEVWNAYMMPLLSGLGEDVDAELDEAIEKMKEAGLDAYLAKVQEQLTAFAQSKEAVAAE